MQQGHKTTMAAPKRRDRLIKEHIHDPYHVRHKPADGTVCADCGLVFRSGNWREDTPAEDANKAVCPACQRARDGMPAGTLALSGQFLSGHRQEMVNLARHVAEREGKAHPLHRIMDIAEQDGGIVITTTDIHLPRKIGQALQKAYDGELKLAYGDEAYSVRVDWSRDG